MKINDIYKCGLCGNIVQVTHAGGGELVCCGKPMALQTENTVEAAHEKHIPVIEKTANGVLVKVGAVAHPMEEKHFIEWIELRAAGRVMRKHLKPGDKPDAEFACCGDCGGKPEAYAYCNLHGYWKGAL